MIAAAVAVFLAAGTWFLIRYAEESQRMDDMIAIVLSTPLANEDEWCDIHGQWCQADWCDR
jgi:hypothetical protein